MSDWPAEIIASLVVSRTGSHTEPLSCGSVFISLGVFRSQFRSALHMQICSSEQWFLSLVLAEVLDITHYRIKGWTVLLTKKKLETVQHHQCTSQHPKLWSIQTLCWTRSLFKTCHSLLTFNVFLGQFVQMLPVIRNRFKKLQTHHNSFVPLNRQMRFISYVPCQIFSDKLLLLNLADCFVIWKQMFPKYVWQCAEKTQ